MRTIKKWATIVGLPAAMVLLPVQPSHSTTGGSIPGLKVAEACAQIGCMYLRPPWTLPPCPTNGKRNYRCNFGCDGVDD